MYPVMQAFPQRALRLKPGRGSLAAWLTGLAGVLVVALISAYVALSVYLAVARSRGVGVLVAIGMRQDVMGRVEYVVGRAIAFVFLAGLFYAVYKFLPKHQIPKRQAAVGALASAVLFEVARNVWTALTQAYDPGSLYTGTLYAVVSVVFWVYYAALIFILGAEVSQAHVMAKAKRDAR